MSQLKTVLRNLRRGVPPPPGLFPGPVQDVLAALASQRGKVSKMTALERVLTATRHKEPDRVPVTPIANAVARQIAGVSFPDYSQSAEAAAEVFEASLDLIGGDLLVLLLDLSVEAEGFGQKIFYPEESTARPDPLDRVIRSVEDYDKIKPVKVADSARMREMVRLCEIVTGRVGYRAMVCGFVFGPLGVLSMLRGAEAFFKDCVNDPRRVMRAAGAVTETLVEFAEAQCDAGVAGVAIDTLFASQSSLPKKLWEDLEGPFSREIARAIKKRKGVVGIHNCGHGVYFDVQIKWMEPDVISFAQLPDDCPTEKDLKERYGDQVTLVGYVETPLLVHGTPAQVMDECKRQAEVLGRDGGFVLAPGCEYPPNASLVNAIAMVRAAEMSG